MDFEAIAKSIADQFVTVWNTPIPFLAALLLGGFMIWKLVQREFAMRLANAQSTNEMLREKLDRAEAAETISIATAAHHAEAAASPSEEPSLPPRAAPRASATPSPVSNAKAFVADNITPEFLVGMLDGRTVVQAKSMLEDQFGRRMLVEVAVKSVQDSSGYISLVGRGDGGTLVMCIFDDTNPAVRELSLEQIVAIEGELEDISTIGITLFHCQIVMA